MNVLIVGSGGREHAIAYGIKKSPELNRLYVMPGNPGTAAIAENISSRNNNDILEFCKSSNIDLVVIGPEKPLVEGLSNLLRENGVRVFGPSRKATDIEASKSFAKKLMKNYNIPTAGYSEFSAEQADQALQYIKNSAYPLVVKADGLAAGKGVLICNSVEDAGTAIKEIFSEKVFGSAGDRIVIEEFLEGEEASVFAITDGTDFVCLPAAQDHKRAGDGDTGKNTGGMGAYAPAPLVTPEIQQKVENKIIKPVLSAMKAEEHLFQGCLYCGLMIKDGEPKVVEFNCRFGDPETQAIIPLLEGSLLRLLYSAAEGKIDKNAVRNSENAAVCVVAASHGYPEYYDTGFEIHGLNDINDQKIVVFHAGTKSRDQKIFTSGGRVLGLTAVTEAGNLQEAKRLAYENLRIIHFENIYYRTDISDKAYK